jgi:hypothetical protein
MINGVSQPTKKLLMPLKYAWIKDKVSKSEKMPLFDELEDNTFC